VERRGVRATWSIINMAHSLAGSWPAFAWLRGLLGFAEGSANPAGMQATAEWFPSNERRVAGGVYNMGHPGSHSDSIPGIQLRVRDARPC
jgi:MFS family permease